MSGGLIISKLPLPLQTSSGKCGATAALPFSKVNVFRGYDFWTGRSKSRESKGYCRTRTMRILPCPGGSNSGCAGLRRTLLVLGASALGTTKTAVAFATLRYPLDWIVRSECVPHKFKVDGSDQCGLTSSWIGRMSAVAEHQA